MPDLFPTTDEAEKDQNIADAAAGGQGIVNHLGPDSFATDGLRPFFEYRPLGLKELTGGKVGAHVIRAKSGQHADAPHHSHALEFQFVYVLKGWAIFDYEGYGQHTGRRLDRLPAARNQAQGDRPLRGFRGAGDHHAGRFRDQGGQVAPHVRVQGAVGGGPSRPVARLRSAV